MSNREQRFEGLGLGSQKCHCIFLPPSRPKNRVTLRRHRVNTLYYELVAPHLPQNPPIHLTVSPGASGGQRLFPWSPLTCRPHCHSVDQEGGSGTSAHTSQIWAKLAKIHLFSRFHLHEAITLPGPSLTPGQSPGSPPPTF